MMAIERTTVEGLQGQGERPASLLLKHLIHESGLEQGEFARRLGVDPSLVSLICNSRRGMGGKMVRALLRAYPEHKDEIIEAFIKDEEGIE